MRHTTEELVNELYDELRRLAHARMRHERADLTITATALVHEAYCRLLKGTDGPKWDSRGHFFASAARAMRRVLIDHIRGRKSKYALPGEIEIVADVPADELHHLDQALVELERHNARQATIVEMRYFTGMKIADIAEALDISERTVKSDWSSAKVWLECEIDRKVKKDRDAS